MKRRWIIRSFFIAEAKGRHLRGTDPSIPFHEGNVLRLLFLLTLSMVLHLSGCCPDRRSHPNVESNSSLKNSVQRVVTLADKGDYKNAMERLLQPETLKVLRQSDVMYERMLKEMRNDAWLWESLRRARSMEPRLGREGTIATFVFDDGPPLRFENLNGTWHLAEARGE